MRKFKNLVMIGFCLLLVACQSEDLFTDAPVAAGEGNVNFTVSAPDLLQMTRATLGENSNSMHGGITNVDFAEYDLRYQLAVYRIDGEGENISYTQVISPQKKVVDSYQAVNYSLRLTPNRNYKFVVWADFVKQGTDTDLHYETGNFENITCIDGVDKQLNDESRDAYFATEEITVGSNGVMKDLTLKRPFAKLRVVATDWGVYNLEMPDNFKITYYGCKRFTNINAVTGLSEGTDLSADLTAVTEIYTGSIDKSQKDYALGYDKSENNRTLTVDYLMTDATEQTPIHFKFEALDGTSLISSHDLKTDIPIQRNWLTTVMGNILTTDAQLTISIDENFENDWIDAEEWWNPAVIVPKEPVYDESTRTYHIYTREEFAWLPDNILDMITKKDESGKSVNVTILLENDTDMSGVEWKPIYTSGEPTYTVDGQGHTLRNFSLNGKFGAVYEYQIWGITLGKYNAYTGVWGKFEGVMKNLTFENITINGLADDEVHTDVDGNPIDHSKEYAYFAGCVGYTGANYSTVAQFENVHAKHMHIKASTGLTTQNVGGLIGWIGVGGGATWLDSCSAEDIYLTGYQAGGLVGQIVGGRGVAIKNCWTENIHIRLRGRSGISGFVGQYNDGAGSKIENCIYPTQLEYVDDKNGVLTDYKPEDNFYGRCSKNKDKLIITTSATLP